jgi:DNA-binding protein Fis
VVLSKSRTLDVEDFSFLPSSPAPLQKHLPLREMEKHYVQQILNEHNGNVTRAAKVLEINRVTLHKMIKRYGLNR